MLTFQSKSFSISRSEVMMSSRPIPTSVVQTVNELALIDNSASCMLFPAMMYAASLRKSLQVVCHEVPLSL